MDAVAIEAVIAGFESELRLVATPERAEHEKRYLKSDLTFIGATVPQTRRVAKAFVRANKDLAAADLVALVEELWSAPVHERRELAVQFLTQYAALLESRDLALVERLVREAKTWAFVDPLAVHVAASLFGRYPDLGPQLDRWAADDDFWVRRAALLVHGKPLSEGLGDFERFGRYADAMLEQTEFFIRKAIGWILREVSKKRPDLVYEWLAPRTARASGVTMREATKYLPPGQAQQLMTAYKQARARRRAGPRDGDAG